VRRLILPSLVLCLLGGAASAGPLRGSLDVKRLPLGDGKYTRTVARKGYVYSCGPHTGGGGAQANGPWIHGKTWDSTAKVHVDGSVHWKSVLRIAVSGGKLRITGNGLPSHPTGIFPIRAGTAAAKYDRNPNSIRAQKLSFSLPAEPKVGARPSCIAGPIGVMLTGALLYDALDAEGRDAPAHEVQDRCDGHPDPTGTYHYHSLSACAGVGRAQKLVGYALDGFGIYAGGKAVSTADLDVCHGITSVVSWHGKLVRMYHYVMTVDFPYSLGCFRGTPVRPRPQAP
jgi:YHYH protein